MKTAEQALLEVLNIVRRYLPPDGINVRDAMSEIIACVDPWLLAPTQPPAASQTNAPGNPVAYRAWFDQDNGARWLFTLWPEEEHLDVTWEPLYATQPPAASQSSADVHLETYDAGLLNDYGGGKIEWWQDYIRAELARAHEFYQSQCEFALAAVQGKK